MTLSITSERIPILISHTAIEFGSIPNLSRPWPTTPSEDGRLNRASKVHGVLLQCWIRIQVTFNRVLERWLSGFS